MKLTEGRRYVNDIILIIILLIIAVITGVILYFGRDDSLALSVEVTADGELIASYLLGEDGSYNIQCQLETGNHLIIQDGEVYLDDADCPDKLCVKQGSIKHAGESIICLPNRLVVKIVGSQNTGDDGLDVMPR